MKCGGEEMFLMAFWQTRSERMAVCGWESIPCSTHKLCFHAKCGLVSAFYNVAALYMVLMNLPRTEWLKSENVFLVGVIPGPHEPKLNINSYLQPPLAELNVLRKDGV